MAPINSYQTHLSHSRSSREGVCDAIIEFMKRAPSLAPVSVQGMAGAPGGPVDGGPVNDNVGSLRTTTWSPYLAKQLEGVFEDLPICKEDRVMDDFTATDWWQQGMHRRWRYVGVSPMLRYMRYEQGGEHYAHYDAAFIYPTEVPYPYLGGDLPLHELHRRHALRAR